MSDEKLTVAELLARRDKERGGSAEAAERPRRRRRSLEEGGISVAELTGSIPRVKADGPRRGAHAAVEDDEQIEDRAEDQVTEAAETADSAEAAEAGESTESGDSTEAAEVDESADVAEVPDEADSAEVESVEAESVEEAVEEPAAEDTAEEPVAEEAVEESAAEEPVEEPAAVEEPADEPVAEEAVEEAAAEESVAEPVAEQPAAVEEPREPREPFSIPSAVPVDPRPVMANDETGEITFTFTKFHDARTGTEPVAEAGPMAREVLEGSMAYDDRPTNVIPVVEDDEDEAEVAVDDAASAREWDEADDRAFDGSAISDGTFTGGSAALADHVDDVPAAYRDHDAEYGAEYEDDYGSDHEADYDSGYDADYDYDHVSEYDEEYDAEPAIEDQRRRGFVDFSDPSDEPESVDPHASAASATAAAPAVKESGAPKSTKDREAYVEDNSLSIGLLIAQTIVGLLFGGLIFALFLMLWMALPKAVVAVIAVAFSFGLVIGVNLIRRERDRLTPVLAGIVGLVVSFAPYVLTMV